MARSGRPPERNASERGTPARPVAARRRRWRELVAYARSRGQTQVTVEVKGYILISTWGMPLYEEISVSVTPAGELAWCSEQSAPMLPGMDGMFAAQRAGAGQAGGA